MKTMLRMYHFQHNVDKISLSLYYSEALSLSLSKSQKVAFSADDPYFNAF